MPNLPLPEGVKTTDLECVMLDLGPLSVRAAYGPDLKEDDFFYGDIPELSYAQGPVAEKQAHVTLLFGIHPSETYVEDVMDKLDGWWPGDVFIRQVGYFPSTIEGQDYKCIIGEVNPSANLLVANKRLAELPHTNTHAYKPHVTLAYIKGSANLDRWVRRLNVHYKNRVVTPTGLNFGLDD